MILKELKQKVEDAIIYNNGEYIEIPHLTDDICELDHLLKLIKALEAATGPLRRIATGDAVQASTMHAIAVQALEAIEKELG